MNKYLMINFNNLIKKIFFKEDEKFFHALSFIIVSLLAIHVILYFNFYKFSSSWLENESKKTTFIVSPFDDEKIIPYSINENVLSFLTESDLVESFKILDSDLIKESLGLENLHAFSGIGMPLIVQVESNLESGEPIYSDLRNIVEKRLIEKYHHKDEIYEVTVMINRVKFFIFLMLLVVSILFAFLILTMIKAALLANFKLLEMLQVMGANSLEIAKSISIGLTKKILPGAFLSLFFVFLVSSLLIKFFGVNFYFFNTEFYTSLNFNNFILLVFFLFAFLFLLLVCLTAYLFYFFEKRFFDEI